MCPWVWLTRIKRVYDAHEYTEKEYLSTLHYATNLGTFSSDWHTKKQFYVRYLHGDIIYPCVYLRRQTFITATNSGPITDDRNAEVSPPLLLRICQVAGFNAVLEANTETPVITWTHAVLTITTDLRGLQEMTKKTFMADTFRVFLPSLHANYEIKLWNMPWPLTSASLLLYFICHPTRKH
jgi:hypothetical protein